MPVILVGRRADGGHRDRLWRWCRARWVDTLGWPIFEGHHEPEEGPFCLAVASNRAAALAGPWDVAFYVGGDWALADPVQAVTAAEMAARTGQLVFAHDHAVVLTADATDRLLNGATIADVVADGARYPNTFSGAFAIPRALWDQIGGFDERFVGWGGEDLAAWAACCALGRSFHRVPGDVMHLWHPRAREHNEGHPGYPANDELMRRYLAAKTNRAATLAILHEPGGPLA